MALKGPSHPKLFWDSRKKTRALYKPLSWVVEPRMVMCAGGLEGPRIRQHTRDHKIILCPTTSLWQSLFQWHPSVLLPSFTFKRNYYLINFSRTVFENWLQKEAGLF